MRNYIICILSLIVCACATHPDEMRSSYVSPIQYRGYDCSQIAEEASRVEERVSELHGTLEKKASTDSKQVAGSLILWPTLFFLDGDGEDAAEYKRLKGEYETLGKVSTEKHCGYQFKK